MLVVQPRTVIPPPGAVCPAIVRNGLLMVSLDVKTMVRGPVADVMPLRSVPGPTSPRPVTWYTSPPRPPKAIAPNPSAPSKAGSPRAGGLATAPGAAAGVVAGRAVADAAGGAEGVVEERPQLRRSNGTRRREERTTGPQRQRLKPRATSAKHPEGRCRWVPRSQDASASLADVAG